jgi:cytochrome c oxidase subunit III
MAADRAKHDYHLVDPGPWPFIGALGAFIALFGAALWLNPAYEFLGIPPFIRPWICGGGGLLGLFTMAGWWRDVVAESVRFGEHRPVVKLSLRFAMVLFIAAETMFFAALFWAWFDAALVARAWPPDGVAPPEPYGIALLATLILLLSGTTVTWTHRAILADARADTLKGLALTVLLGAVFTILLAWDLLNQPFGFGFSRVTFAPLTDPAHLLIGVMIGSPAAIYGSLFFLLTGAFLLHVAAGTVFLAVCLWRAWLGHFTPQRHFGFAAAAWFWHFGDVLWLFIYTGLFVAAGALAGH